MGNVIGVLTAGGDCPGLNAVIRAVVTRTTERHDAEVVGILNGWEGLMQGRTRSLDRDSVRGILARGGTILGTSRMDPYVHGDGYESVRRTIERNGIDSLVVIGGDGTLRYLHRYPLGTGGGTNIYTSTTYDDGAWYHAAMVKSVDTIALYIYGELVDSVADTSVFNPGDTFVVVLGILDHERAPGRLFPGAMDDVRIYDIALTAEDIAALAQ